MKVLHTTWTTSSADFSQSEIQSTIPEIPSHRSYVRSCQPNDV